MDKVEIRISRDVLDMLSDLPVIFEQLGYKFTIEVGEKFVDEIVDFIYSLPDRQHYVIPQEFEYHFVRYGNPKYYAFFKRKSSTTTWYVFFKKIDSYKWLVTHISNNWIEGQYIRG